MNDLADARFERMGMPGYYGLTVTAADGVQTCVIITDIVAQRLNRDIVRIINEDGAYLAAQEERYERDQMVDPRA